MPKQTTWYGRYDQQGKPYGFDKNMKAITGQQYAGKAVAITFTVIEEPPSKNLRGFFFVAYLPAFMEIMNQEADWDLLPTIAKEKAEAKTKTIAMFHRSHQILVGANGEHMVNPPRFSDLSQADLLAMMERMERFVNQWGYNLPEPTDGPKKYSANH